MTLRIFWGRTNETARGAHVRTRRARARARSTQPQGAGVRTQHADRSTRTHEFSAECALAQSRLSGRAGPSACFARVSV